MKCSCVSEVKRHSAESSIVRSVLLSAFAEVKCGRTDKTRTGKTLIRLDNRSIHSQVAKDSNNANYVQLKLACPGLSWSSKLIMSDARSRY